MTMIMIHIENRSYLVHHLTLFKCLLKNKLCNSFLWIGFNCLKSAESLQEDSLLLTTKSPGNLGTHLIHLGRIKGRVKLEVN